LERGGVELECLIPRRSDERGGFLYCLEHGVGVPQAGRASKLLMINVSKWSWEWFTNIDRCKIRVDRTSRHFNYNSGLSVP